MLNKLRAGARGALGETGRKRQEIVLGAEEHWSETDNSMSGALTSAEEL